MEITGTLLNMLKSCKATYDGFVETGMLDHLSPQAVLTELMTISFKLPRRSGHTFAAIKLMEELPNACIIGYGGNSRVYPESDHIFSVSAAQDASRSGKIIDNSYDYVIVDNWSCLQVSDRKWIIELCTKFKKLPYIIQLA